MAPPLASVADIPGAHVFWFPTAPERLARAPPPSVVDTLAATRKVAAMSCVRRTQPPGSVTKSPVSLDGALARRLAGLARCSGRVRRAVIRRREYKPLEANTDILVGDAGRHSSRRPPIAQSGGRDSPVCQLPATERCAASGMNRQDAYHRCLGLF